MASFAAKLGDTCGSEIGKRWGRTTISLSRLRVVAPGTEGAVSLEGTLASLAGAGVFSLIGCSLSLVGWELLLPISLIAWLATLVESVIGSELQLQPLCSAMKRLMP